MKPRKMFSSFDGPAATAQPILFGILNGTRMMSCLGLT